MSAAQLAMHAADDLIRAEVYGREPLLRDDAAAFRERAIRSLQTALLQLEAEPQELAA